jgi:hypothetical protein
MMFMSFMSMLMFVLSGSLGEGGGNELVYYIPTKEYWQSKGVAVNVESMTAELKAPATPIQKMDPEALKSLEEAARSKEPAIADAARQLLVKQRAGDKPGQIRRLMAIRALGEMKDAKAVDALRPLTTSTEPFVADHATRALAQIEGKPVTYTAAPAETREKDLWLLPAGLGAVGQVSVGGGGEGKTLAQILAQLQPEYGERVGQIPQMLIEHLLPLAEKTGNMRLDAVTVGAASNIGPEAGFFVAVFRGQYDTGAMKYVMSQQARSEMVDGVEVFRPDSEVALFFPDGEHAVFIAGANREVLPVNSMIAHCKAGAGKLKENAELMPLIEGIDRRQAIWAAVRVSPAYRSVLFRDREPVVNAFDTMTLVGKQEAAAMKLEVKAKGTDPAQMKGAVERLQGLVQQGLAQTERMAQAQRTPMLQPWMDFLKSIQIAGEGTDATLTATLNPTSPAMLLMPMFGVRAAPVPQ